MNANSCRRFNFGDAMIVVATIAVGMTLLPDDVGIMLREAWFEHQLPTVVTAIVVAKLLVTPWFCWTVAYFGFRWRQPRPTWRQIHSQPGFVAAIAAMVMGGLQFALISSSPDHDRLKDDLFDLVAAVSPMVIGGWFAIWLVGRFQPEPGWIDGLGRTLGWGWIAFYLIQQIDSRFFAVIYR